MSEPIIFYDLARRVTAPEDNAWSPNTWKTRYSLNIKRIPYKTVWVEYPEIPALYAKLGAVAVDTLPDGTAQPTLPLIYDPNTRTSVADSAHIARYLDKTYPSPSHSPSLIPRATDALHAAFQAAFAGTLMGGEGDFPRIMLPESCKGLNEASEPYFRRTREARLGGRLEELAPAGSELRKSRWEGVRRAWGVVAGWLDAGGEEGRVLFLGEGEEVCYADVTVASFLVWMRIVLGEESEEWREVVSWDGGRWGRLMEIFKKYESVDAGTKLVL